MFVLPITDDVPTTLFDAARARHEVRMRSAARSGREQNGVLQDEQQRASDKRSRQRESGAQLARQSCQMLSANMFN